MIPKRSEKEILVAYLSLEEDDLRERMLIEEARKQEILAAARVILNRKKPRKLKPLNAIGKEILKVLQRAKDKGVKLKGMKYCEALHAAHIWPDFKNCAESCPALYELDPTWQAKIRMQRWEVAKHLK